MTARRRSCRLSRHVVERSPFRSSAAVTDQERACARAHIGFVQAQMLPWQPGLPRGNRPGVETKTLSRDDSDGSATRIVRYPAGWGLAAAEYLTAHEEFLVLKGALEINGPRYDTHTRGFLPRLLPPGSAFATPGLLVVNALVDSEAGAELKTNPDVRMIVFSYLVAGQAAAGMSAAVDGPRAERPR
jgi:hypothetical protein